MENLIQNKSFSFALRIVNLCKYLQTEKKEFILAKQLLRSGTSIGANVAESEHAQSRADFSSKLNIALKEAAETDYWLRLLHEADFLSYAEFQSVYADCKELERLLAAIVKTMKKEFSIFNFQFSIEFARCCICCIMFPVRSAF